jgi:RHS repeat-associated protein
MQYKEAANFGRGYKQYELTNHLGNVLVTISDRKFAVSSTTNSSLIDHYEPVILTAQRYYPFGMISRAALPNNGQTYRFGFNGKENDNGVKGLGNQQDYGMRIYDPRVGRFLSVDPLTKGYPELTPYQFASNTPIQGIDLDGGEIKFVTDWLADRAKASGHPTLSGFIRGFGGLDVESQQVELTKNVVKGDYNAVAGQLYGYTTEGMATNLLKTAKKAIIDNDQEAYGELYSVVAQGTLGEVTTGETPSFKFSEHPVAKTNKLAIEAHGGNFEATEGNAANSTTTNSATAKSTTTNSTATNSTTTSSNTTNLNTTKSKTAECVDDGKVSSDLVKKYNKLNKKPRPYLDFTKAGKDVVKDINKEMNGGNTVCVNCGKQTIPAAKSQKGVTPAPNETHIDHVKRREDGGSGTPVNGDVLCERCNVKEKH